MSRFAKRSQNPVGPPSPLHVQSSKKVTDASPSLIAASYMRPLGRKVGGGLNEHQKSLLLTLQSQQKSQKRSVQPMVEESQRSAAPETTKPETVNDDSSTASARNVPARHSRSKSIISMEDDKSALDHGALIFAKTSEKQPEPEPVMRVELDKMSVTPMPDSTLSRRSSISTSTSTLRSASPSVEQQQQHHYQQQQQRGPREELYGRTIEG